MPRRRPNEVSIANYEIRQLFGLREILEYVHPRTLTHAEIRVSDWAAWTGWNFYTGAGVFRHQEESALQFTDGSILAALATGHFRGTFSSGEDTRVAYFVLTPKCPA